MGFEHVDKCPEQVRFSDDADDCALFYDRKPADFAVMQQASGFHERCLRRHRKRLRRHHLPNRDAIEQIKQLVG